MKRTQLYLTREQELLLRQLSRERRCSISDLVREAIDRTYRQEASLAEVKQILEDTAGLWASREEGEAYVERMRDGRRWNERLEELRPEKGT